MNLVSSPAKQSKTPPDASGIWAELPHPFLILAPMEGVTDPIFRQVVSAAGRPDLFFTEFTNVSSFASEKGRFSALRRLEVTESDPPIIAQVWGKNPDHFSLLAKELKSLGFSGIDLNFGCPDRHVNAAGGGAAMIRTPELAVACIKQAQASAEQSGHLPLSVKTRLGYSSVDEWRPWLSLLLAQELSALTIHLRTRKEMSKVPAHYELIDDILALRDQIAPATKLIINGDIRDRAAALALHQRHPGVDGFMIGRGVFTNPYCFTERNAEHNPPSRAELMKLLRLHLELFEAAQTRDSAEIASGSSPLLRPRSFEPLKHYFKIYLRDFPGAAELRSQLMEAHSVAEARESLPNY